MEYDPIKFRLAKLVGRSIALRRAFHWFLDLLFLRAWYVRKELWRIRRTVKPHPVILDAGMGFGQYSDRMSRIFEPEMLVGLEIDKKHLYGGVRYFNKVYPATKFTLGDVQSLPIANNSLDLILSVDVMEHIPDDEATFKEFSRILRPGGVFVMHTPRDMREEEQDHGASEGDRWEVGEHCRDGYSDEDITQKLSSAGLSVERLIHDYGPFGKLAWKLLQQYPLQMFHSFGWIVTPVMLIYLAIAIPLGVSAMMIDIVVGDHPKGGGILAVARKPS